MLTHAHVRDVVVGRIRELLEEAFLEQDELRDEENLVSIGFDSLMLARLVADLEHLVGSDPFATGGAHVAELRTIGDVVRIYSASRAER